MSVRIKDEFKETRIAFGTSAGRLGDRTQSDIEDLALMARESRNKRLMRYFAEIPSLDALRKLKADRALAIIDDAFLETIESTPIESK